MISFQELGTLQKEYPTLSIRELASGIRCLIFNYNKKECFLKGSDAIFFFDACDRNTLVVERLVKDRVTKVQWALSHLKVFLTLPTRYKNDIFVSANFDSEYIDIIQTKNLFYQEHSLYVDDKYSFHEDSV